MRKMAASVAVASILVLGGSTMSAHAAVVVAVPGSFGAGYATPRAVHVKASGAPLTFVNGDATLHDVRATASKPRTAANAAFCDEHSLGGVCPMFSSDLIDIGEVAEVEGLGDVPPGEYVFYCTAHVGTMKGTLIVQ